MDTPIGYYRIPVDKRWWRFENPDAQIELKKKSKELSKEGKTINKTDDIAKEIISNHQFESKTTVVDLGSYSSKVGFSGTSEPLEIIESYIGRPYVYIINTNFYYSSSKKIKYVTFHQLRYKVTHAGRRSGLFPHATTHALLYQSIICKLIS